MIKQARTRDTLLIENYQLQSRVRILENLLVKGGKAEEADLGTGTQVYRQMIEESQELIGRVLPDYTITFANKAMCAFLKKSREKITGHKLYDLVPDRMAEEFMHFLTQSDPYKRKRTYHIQIDELPRETWLEWTKHCIFSPDHNLLEIQVMARNISTRKKAEQELRESEAYYRTIFETTGTAMMIYQNDMKITLVNSEFEKLSGYSRSEVENKMYWTEFIDDLDLNKMIHYHSVRRVAPAKVPPKYEFRLRDRWNNVKNVYITVAPIIENDTVVVSFMDITQRKITEQALRQSENRFASILSSSPNELAITTLSEGRFIHVNQRFCRSIEWSQDEVIGHTASELQLWMNPVDRVELVDLLLKDGHVRNREYCVRCKSGRVLTTLVSAETLELDGNQCMIVLMNDISELKEMEKEIARLDQLNLVGEIAASIGHEVRNPMTSVRGFLQLLKDEERFQFYQEYFDIMIDDIDRANHIISEFLNMARHKNVDLKLSSLNLLIEKLTPLIHSDAVAQDKHLMVELNDIPDIMLDEKEIRQMILNLVQNGLEAMEPGGKLLLQTHFEQDIVILMVSDEGPGIPADLMDKIGVPFFSTKEEGTGLGLPVCYSIAARHNANIKINTGNKGTRFYICFSPPANEIRCS